MGGTPESPRGLGPEKKSRGVRWGQSTAPPLAGGRGAQPALSAPHPAHPHSHSRHAVPVPTYGSRGLGLGKITRVPWPVAGRAKIRTEKWSPHLGINALSKDLKFLALNLCFVRGGLWDSGALGSPAQQTPTPHSPVGARPGHEGPRTREQPQTEGARHYTADESHHHGETRSAGKWEKLFPARESGALGLHPSLEPTKEGAHPGQTEPASPHDRRPFGKGPERGRGCLWGRTRPCPWEPDLSQVK